MPTLHRQKTRVRVLSPFKRVDADHNHLQSGQVSNSHNHFGPTLKHSALTSLETAAPKRSNPQFAQISSPRAHPLLVIRNDVVAKEENDMNSLNLPIDTVSSMGHFSIEHVLKHRKEKSPITNSLIFGHFSSSKDPSTHSLKQLSQMTTLFRLFIPTIFRLFAHMKE